MPLMPLRLHFSTTYRPIILSMSDEIDIIDNAREQWLHKGFWGKDDMIIGFILYFILSVQRFA